MQPDSSASRLDAAVGVLTPSAFDARTVLPCSVPVPWSDIKECHFWDCHKVSYSIGV
jgi:hypothetical protein